jgi:hypothetical protein
MCADVEVPRAHRGVHAHRKVAQLNEGAPDAAAVPQVPHIKRRQLGAHGKKPESLRKRHARRWRRRARRREEALHATRPEHLGGAVLGADGQESLDAVVTHGCAVRRQAMVGSLAVAHVVQAQLRVREARSVWAAAAASLSLRDSTTPALTSSLLKNLDIRASSATMHPLENFRPPLSLHSSTLSKGRPTRTPPP